MFPDSASPPIMADAHGLPALSVAALTLRVPRRTLVETLDWRVEPGQRWCLLGRNGAGKSTLLKTLVGLRPAHAHGGGGRIDLFGQPLETVRPLQGARLRAWCAQQTHDAFGLRALDVVLASRWPWRQMDAEAAHHEDLARAALARCDAAHLADHDVRTLSGGERQRVALAAALAQATPLLLLDEPTAHLDIAHQIGLLQTVSRACQECGQTLIASLHDVNLAARYFSHALLLMGDGRWHAGPVEQSLNAERLSEAYGYPLQRLDVTLPGGDQPRWLFVPRG